MGLPPHEHPAVSEPEVAIEVCGVYKTFGQQQIHRGVDLKVLKGKTTVIVGHSGAGKSVLLKYILGLIQPDRGKIIVGGQDIVAMNHRQLYAVRSKFGVLFQGSALLDSLDVFDNVALPLREKTKMNEEDIYNKVVEKLRLVGIEDALYKYPSELSGGMQRRVALARALQRDPEIVLFDEPTTGLDPETTHNIYDLFEATQARLGYTALIVSHDIPKVFRIADYVAVLNQGRMLAHMPPDELPHCGNEWVQKMLTL